MNIPHISIENTPRSALLLAGYDMNRVFEKEMQALSALRTAAQNKPKKAKYLDLAPITQQLRCSEEELIAYALVGAMAEVGSHQYENLNFTELALKLAQEAANPVPGTISAGGFLATETLFSISGYEMERSMIKHYFGVFFKKLNNVVEKRTGTANTVLARKALVAQTRHKAHEQARLTVLSRQD